MNAHEVHVMNLSKTANEHRAALADPELIYNVIYCAVLPRNRPLLLRTLHPRLMDAPLQYPPLQRLGHPETHVVL